MSFEPNPKQALVLWMLLITQEMPSKSKLWPELNSKELEELEQAGLIRIAERKKLREEGLIDLKGRAKHILPTDKTWDWASNNFDVEIRGTKYTNRLMPLIQDFLQLIDKNSKSRDFSLADFLNPQSTEERICEAYLKISHGNFNVRVRLSELRQHLENLSRTDVDRTLSEMELAEKLSLMPLDDPQEIYVEDEEAAIDMGGPKRHILYMKG